MVDIFLVALRLVVKQRLQAGRQPTGHRELTLKDDASFFGCGQTTDPTPGNVFYHRDVVALYIFIIAGLPYIATALRDRTNTDGNFSFTFQVRGKQCFSSLPSQVDINIYI